MSHDKPGVFQVTLSRRDDGRPSATGTDGVLARQQHTMAAPACVTTKGAQACER